MLSSVFEITINLEMPWHPALVTEGRASQDFAHRLVAGNSAAEPTISWGYNDMVIMRLQ